MAYTCDMTKLLSDQLAKFAVLNRYQLVGHVANLDFWLGEVRHCLEVIDGYSPRFERLRAAQTRYVSEHKTVQVDFGDPRQVEGPAAPPKRMVTDSALKEARRSLSDSTYGFIVRCYREGLIEEPAMREACGGLGIGIDPADLNRRAPDLLARQA